MRVFLSVYENFSLAIPIVSVSSIILFNENTNSILDYNQENRNTYISLPRLFNHQAAETKHGLVLKDADNDDNAEIENRNILLTTKIECETDIPDKNIYPVPKTLAVLKFSHIFGGIIFCSNDRDNFTITGFSEGELILLLNPKDLVQNIKRN